MLIQPVDVQIAVNPAPANQFFQRCFGQSLNIHRLFADKMDKLLELSRLAASIVAEQRLDRAFLAVLIAPSGFVDTGGFPAARAPVRVCAFQHKAAAVQIVFHMRNDEIPFRYQNAVSRHQLQIFNKGKIVQARSGHLTAIDFHRRKDCDRGNLAGASGRPFNHLKLCFKQIILKFERQSVLIVVACTPAAFGEGHIIVGDNDAVDRNILVSGILLQLLDSILRLCLRQRSLGHQILAGGKSQRRELFQPLRLARQVFKSLQHSERHEHQTPLHTGLGIQQAYRASRQIASVFVGLSVIVHQRGLQLFKIAGSNECLSSDHQTIFISDMRRYAANGAGIVGHDFAHFPIASGSSFQQFATLIG